MVKNIDIKDISKKYHANNWIFKNFSLQLESGAACAILGANGSGKSTLIKILSGYVSPTEGSIQLDINGKTITPENYFQHVSMAAPWFELIEDFTLLEYLSFHRKFRNIIDNLSNTDLLEISNLTHVKNLPVHNFSSGMKQRVRLLLAFFTESDILLLDEPTANLDSTNIAWYKSLIQKYTKERITFVASNHIAHEYDFCTTHFEISDLEWKRV